MHVKEEMTIFICREFGINSPIAYGDIYRITLYNELKNCQY